MSPLPSVAVLNSPRSGGPLRWSIDLVRFIQQSGKYNARLMTNVWSIGAAQLRAPADIVHAAVPILRHWRNPYVLTVKGEYTIERHIWRFLYPRAIRRADVVTVPSQYLKGRIADLRDALVIPNAVDLSRFTVAPLLGREQVNIAMVTNFWFADKAEGVCRAISLLEQAATRNHVPRVIVTVIGAGKHLETVRRRLGRSSLSIRFTGWIDPRTELARADLFLYHSSHDNMPNAILEPMASGVPVLTNRVGAVAEMIETGSDGFIARDDQEYVSLLSQLLTDPDLRRRIGAAARARVEHSFSWSSVVSHYLAIYQRLG